MQGKYQFPFSVSRQQLLPIRPSNPKCPNCKAYIAVNSMSPWSKCGCCAMSFHDIDGRFRFSAIANYVYPVPEIDKEKIFRVSEYLPILETDHINTSGKKKNRT